MLNVCDRDRIGQSQYEHVHFSHLHDPIPPVRCLTGCTGIVADYYLTLAQLWQVCVLTFTYNDCNLIPPVVHTRASNLQHHVRIQTIVHASIQILT